MAQVSFDDFVNGVVPDSSDFNDRYNALKNRINNGMESDNLADGSVSTNKIVNLAVTDAKIADVAGLKLTGSLSSAVAGSTKGKVVLLNNTYVFNVSGLTTLPNAGATYTNNFKIFTVVSSTATNVYATGTGDPEASGSLTKTAGTGDASISFSSHTGQVPAVDGSLMINTNPVGSVVQVVNYQTGAWASGTGTIPYDDTIPQSSEGDEYMTLAITPKSATNVLKIEVVGNFFNSSGGDIVMALFQDSTANALSAVSQYDAGGVPGNIKFTHYMAAGTTSATTFKMRAGAQAGTTRFNGNSTNRIFGGVMASSITITEIKA